MAENTNKKSKNSLPAFSRGTIEELRRGLELGVITPPAIHFLTEDNKKCLAFVDIDNTIYEINLERIEKIESLLEGMKTPEGEVIPVPEYVEQSITPIQEQVSIIDEKVGGVYMLIGGES